MIWFTSDTHFGHANIIKYTDRPFDDVDEMDDALVENWNLIVGPTDEVYHLGDFTLGDNANKYLRQLNGFIRILGNPWHHDSRWLPSDFGSMDGIWSRSHKNIAILPPVVVLESEEYGADGRALPIVLCHYPFAKWDRKHYGAWHLFGHCHAEFRPSGFSLDVGVDNCCFRPISLTEVAEYMLDLGWYPGWREFGEKRA